MKVPVFRTLIVGAFLALALSSGLQAADPEAMQKIPTITVTGEAVVNADPDQAEIDIGVTTEAESASAASADNAAKLSKVMAALKKTMAARGELRTIGYSVDPVYRHPRSEKPEIAGYRATNIVRAKTEDLKGIGQLMDIALSAGANRVHRLLFTLKETQSVQELALREATLNAQGKANAIAKALGANAARVVSVTENERGFRPVMAEARALGTEAMAPPTPVEAGTIEVRSSVTYTVELGRQPH